MHYPEKTIGLLGGGQLGKMFAVAAAQYGYTTLAVTPEHNPIIAHVAQHLRAEYTDTQTLDQLLKQSQAVTLEFENIPVDAVRYLSEKTMVRPGLLALETAQDRRLEKAFFAGAGIPVANYVAIDSEATLQNCPQDFTFPAILKTARDGYDGKGQVKVQAYEDLPQAWQSLKRVPCVLEGFVAFDQELSVIIARGVGGDTAIYGPILNEHEHHILSTSWSGLPWPAALQTKAEEIAIIVANKLDYVGVLCIELFQVGDDLIVNEMAPRPHNSGHLTIEGFSASQFDQQVRTTLGLPVAPVVSRGPTAMLNVIGQAPSDESLKSLQQLPQVHWHWYGKTEAKPGRKLGHITVEAASMESLKAAVAQVKALL